MDLSFITDKKGVLWANFPVFPEAIGKDLSNRDWYKGISKNWKPYISTFFQLIVSDKPFAVALCVPVFDQNGNVIGVLANSQRLNSLEKIFFLVDFNPVTVINVLDREGNIIYSNKLSYKTKITKYLYYSNIQDVLKENKNQFIINTKSILKDKKYLTFQTIDNFNWIVVIERGIFDTFCLEINYYIMIIIIIFMIFVLISGFLIYLNFQIHISNELCKKNEAIMESEFILNDTQQKAGLGSWTYDPVSQQPNWSKEMFNIWGLDPKLGAPNYASHKNYIHPDDYQDFDKLVQRALEKGEPFIFEKRICRPDKTVRTVVTICEPQFDKSGKVIRLRGTNQDITERKLAEEKIKNLLAEKELILKDTHHRIKNNLNTVLSFLTLQKITLEDQKDIDALDDSESRV